MIIRIRKNAVIITAVVMICLGAIGVKGAILSKTDNSNEIKLPIIMYHQLSTKNDNLGKYVLSTQQLERDLQYIKGQGYETVTIKDLTEYVNGNKKLPEKIVMLTFDDGYETGYTRLLPLLKKYNMKAVLSVIGSVTDIYTENQDHNDYYSYLNWDTIRLLGETEEIEIQNHSYNLHFSGNGHRNGIKEINGESFNEYYLAMENDLGKMQTALMEKCGIKPACMVYPFGEYSENTLEVCKKLGFTSTLTCEEKINTIIKYQNDSLFNLGRYNRPTGADSEEFFKDILT